MSKRESFLQEIAIGEWKDAFHDAHESVKEFVERITLTSNRIRPEALRGGSPPFVSYYVGGSKEKFALFLRYLMQQMAITEDDVRELVVDQRRGDINVALEEMMGDSILNDPNKKRLFIVHGFDQYIQHLKKNELEGKIARAAHDLDQNAGELLPEHVRSRYANRDAPIIVIVHISDHFGADVERTALQSAGESQFKMGVFQL